MPDTTKVSGARGGGFAAYRRLVYGDVSIAYVLKAECLFALFGSLPGAAGIWLRSRCYAALFGTWGRGVLIGRNVTFRHPRKIHLGDNVIIDDGAMVDAKGEGNAGIRLDTGVFVGRNSILYCKGGAIHLERNVNVSSHCTLFSSNSLTVGADTVIGAYSYLLSGGEYDIEDPTPFAGQSGKRTRGPLVIGRNCWLGARVTVLDGTGIDQHSVIGAGAVVNRPVPENSVAAGIPARVIRQLGRGGT